MTPQLRFPEFTDEWRVERLGDISDKGKYGIAASSKTYDGVNKYLRITDIDEDTHKFSYASLTSPSGIFTDQYLLQEHDLVFARTGASVGKSYLYNSQDGKVYFAGFLIKFHITGADSKFIYYQTLRESYEKWVVAMSARSGQPGINAEEYETLKFALPSEKEQQKIADFLTTVDARAEALTQKIDQLETYKRGVMQKLFSQQIRFTQPDGSPFPDWETKTFGDVINYEQPTRYIVKSTDYDDSNKTPVLTAGKSFILGYTNENDGIYLASEAPVVIFDDFTTSSHFVDFDFKIKSSAMKILKAKNGNSTYLLSLTLKNKEIDEVTDHRRHWIGEYQNMTIDLPEKNEQQKIATFLAAIDEKITLTREKLNKTNEFKKGLLQRMFV